MRRMVAVSVLALCASVTRADVVCMNKRTGVLAVRPASCKKKESVYTGALGPTGPKGEPGLAGEAGAPGTAIAYAHVMSDGTIDAANSLNMSSAVVSHSTSGIYCFTGLGFTPHNLLVTVDPGGALGSSEIVTGFGRIGALGCGTGTEVSVIFTQSGSGTFANRNFFIAFN
jgi:hypothetical protein